MDEISIGPEENDDQPVQSGVDAQSETERDIERGLAGAEAKPFSEPGKAKISDTEHGLPKAIRRIRHQKLRRA